MFEDITEGFENYSDPYEEGRFQQDSTTTSILDQDINLDVDEGILEEPTQYLDESQSFFINTDGSLGVNEDLAKQLREQKFKEETTGLMELTGNTRTGNVILDKQSNEVAIAQTKAYTEQQEENRRAEQAERLAVQPITPEEIAQFSETDIELLQEAVGTEVDGMWGKNSQQAYNDYLKNGGISEPAVQPITHEEIAQFSETDIELLQKAVGTGVDGMWGKNSQQAYNNYLKNGGILKTVEDPTTTTKDVVDAVGIQAPSALKQNPLKYLYDTHLGLDENDAAGAAVITGFFKEAGPGPKSFISRTNVDVTKTNGAWCGVLADHVLSELGQPRLGGSSWQRMRAKAYATVGDKVSKIADAKPGDVVVMKSSSGYHVAFFASANAKATKFAALGGNQGNKVQMSKFDASKIYAIRRFSDIETMAEEDMKKITKDIVFDTNTTETSTR